jgi:hypothetical protein
MLVNMSHKKKVRRRQTTSTRPGEARKSPRLVAFLVALTALIASFSLAVFAQKGKPAKTTEELPPGAMRAKATTACTECHEERIILQQRLSKGAWTKEVDKMIRWGAVVDAADRDALIDYLSTNFSPDRPPYTPTRTIAKPRVAGQPQ